MRKALIGAGLGVAAALVALLIGRLPFVEVIELKTYDWRMRATAGSVPARSDIVLVTIDEESLRGLEPLVGRWPWPRLVHAQLLNYLARAKPRVVLYDILFTEEERRKFFVEDVEWTGRESDDALVESAEALTVVFPGDAVPEALEEPSSTRSLPRLPGLNLPASLPAESRPVFVPPIPGLLRTARVVAHNFGPLDPDGPVRRYVPLVRHEGVVIPSLAVATAALAQGGGHVIRAVPEGLQIGRGMLKLSASPGSAESAQGETRKRAFVDFRSRPRGAAPYRRLSFYRLFYAEQQLLAGETPVESPEQFRDAIVIVGATAAALYDTYTIPLAGGKVGGSEVHAAVVDAILAGRTLAPARLSHALLLTVVSAALMGVAASLVGPWAAIALGALAWSGVIWFATSQFAAGMVYPLVVPLAALTLTTFGDVAYEYFVEGREKRRVKRLFSRFVSKDVYEQILKNPIGANLGGQRRLMTVLFSDIRGFTTVSEQGQPEAIVAQLNEYFSRMVPIVFEHRGTIDKFVGDMIMALYGAPLDDGDHADHAVQTALAMSQALIQLNHEWRAKGWPELDIGIGINTGEMVAGNLGSEAIMSYTVVGDNVNLGSRLESLTKEFHTRLIVSEATVAALKGRYDIRALGAVVVKGKSVPVKVFSVQPPTSGGTLDPGVVAADTPGGTPPPPAATGATET